MKTVLISHIVTIIMLLPLLGKTQLATISGNVMDSESGEALESVTVFESSTEIGTITNENGFFKLELSTGELIIKIANNGFNDFVQPIVLKCDTTLNVMLEPEIQNKNRSKKQEIFHADVKTTKKISGQRRAFIK